MSDNATPAESETAADDVTPIQLPDAGGHEGASPREVTEHPAVAPLSWLLGRWKGTGKGDYPTIPAFNFYQEVTFTHIGKPYLIYTSRSWRLAEDENGEPSTDEN